MKAPVIIVAGVLTVGFGALAFRQRQTTATLREEISVEQSQGRRLEQLRGERQRLTAAQLPAAEMDQLRRDHAELVTLKGERDGLTKSAVKPAEPATPRPIPKNAVPLKALRNVGRGSPSAAFQTAIWAVVNNQDEGLPALTMSPANRELGQKIIASLPEKERSRYSSPEKLWALFAAPELAKWDQIAVVNETIDQPGQATLTVASSGEEPELKIQTLLATDGWQLVIPEPHMGGIEQQFRKLIAPKIVQKLVP